MSKRKPKPSLRDLSREVPTLEESVQLRKELREKPDIQVVISTCAGVDRELENLIFYRLKIKDPEAIKELTSDGAPLSSFRDKIEFGRVLKLYPDDVAKNLHIIRRIRNVFD